ncbi:complex I subunit 1 family protein [Geomonas sp.]|uniref:complex I subunit 1/NuoH family protein n=1 Tax=Geomonas sp. TaxID=2651584 RepID=UPI002B4961E3|nr:complex I subunit 1 family protein [Geomonas sp.]HJV35099.1 complex I subunit 1 family protein [Geomonas sp.]
MMPDLIVTVLYIAYAIGFMLGLATLFTWVERKQSAIMADRIGANRCYLRVPFTDLKVVAWGLFHGIADGAKMLLKENFTPTTYDRFCYNLAPWLVAVPVLLTFAVIPFGGNLMPGHLSPALHPFFGDAAFGMQVAHLDAGILVILAISGVGIIGTMLAGWSSNNKFSLLGAARAASQMISYEVSMGLALISLVVTYGTLDLNEMVLKQRELIMGVVPAWGIFVQPLAFVLFLTAAIAENKRVPFDLPECESELVAGYFTEYSAMKMGLFMLSEFIEIVVVSALLVTLFLGGYSVPWLTETGFVFPFGGALALPHLAVVVLQMAAFLVKVTLAGCFQIQIRWSLPRFRYDQLMRFGWQFLLPLGGLNLVGTAFVRWLTLRG